MPLAHVDMPVARDTLILPSVRRSLRLKLYQALAKMGPVDGGTIRYVQDPLDGPLAEQGLPNDDIAILRISANVGRR